MSVITPVAVRPRPTRPAFTENPRAETWTVSVPDVRPVPDAVIVSLPALAVEVTVTVLLVWF